MIHDGVCFFRSPGILIRWFCGFRNTLLILRVFFHVKWWVKEVNEMSFQLNGLIDCLNYLLGPQVDYFWLWIEYVQIILNVFGPKKGLNTQNYLKHLPQKMFDTVLTHFFQGFWSPKLLTTELPKQTENSPENFM